MNHDDEKGQQMVLTPGGYDPEAIQIAGNARGDVLLHLPGITYLDTQVWSADVGLTVAALAELRDAIDNHLRDTGGPVNRVNIATVVRSREDLANDNRGDIDTDGADGGTACPPVVGQQPTTVVQQPTFAAPTKGAANDRPSSRSSVVTETVTVPLRDRLRAALRRHIDPDDDTMPAIWPGGDFIWLGTDSVIDDLVAAVGAEQLIAERDQAVAAVERVRAECAAIGTPHICNAVDRILGVLDQPKEQR
ncbi:hypothetical protein [Streptomyces sp. NPDC048445]|uniref:hypothetical protein n=1 Tax=Streptomyces sp. NPDC048445 TaxID=3365553 RepID=UPI00371BDCFD